LSAVQKTSQLESWGRYPKAVQAAVKLNWSTEPLPWAAVQGTVLPRGKGRSYGDVCLNDGGTLLLTEALDRFIALDAGSGVLRCEAGVTLEQILHLAVPRGWFLPVTPGTKFVTVGGAVANDVHGKNHHRMGTFGRHVRAFELLRSDGSRRVCSPTENPDWFRATIGGLGLTGLMTWVEIQLKKIASPFLAVEHVQYRNLDEFFRLARESEAGFEHTVAWVDCLARGASLGRGIFMRGNDATAAQSASLPAAREKKTRTFPADAPGWTLNRFTVAAFNTLFFHRLGHPNQNKLLHYDPFFYPLDSILEWNRLYGRRGFFQYQFVVPLEQAETAVAAVLEKTARSGAASFLSVMKTFGDCPSPGLLSFPRKGLTLAMDFPNLGDRALRLMRELDEVVLGRGGILYPAKDARMSAACFQESYPQWKEFAGFIDPRFSSSFWRRVTP
jgi:FAD/FMN-containing dehydrogenase